jgi:5-oxoprolinase (ATP-hydrolysing) subunit C
VSTNSKRSIEVLEAGIQTTVQDYPGRYGMRARGFFPAGPMDHFAFRAANLLVGNPPGAAALEVTLGGLALRAQGGGAVAVCGAEAEVTVDGKPLPLWESRQIDGGAELRIGLSTGPGFRLYVAFSGGIDVPPLFDSRSTYTMGALGGFEGRALQSGDQLVLVPERDGATAFVPKRMRDDLRPVYTRDWSLEAMPGPQAAPDFLTEDDVGDLFERWWTVDRNSNRTGIRLEPHKFRWARESGGIAGGHPSNILDNSYPVGAVNINGDLPVILAVDGPTAGGFIVAATVVRAALWKIGQLRPTGDRLRFREVDLNEAIRLNRELEKTLTAQSLEDV